MGRWAPDANDTEPADLTSAVLQAVGAASVCWATMDGTGVFDEQRALEVAYGLIDYLGRFGEAEWDDATGQAARWLDEHDDTRAVDGTGEARYG
jgi:hypothetical protein